MCIFGGSASYCEVLKWLLWDCCSPSVLHVMCLPEWAANDVWPVLELRKFNWPHNICGLADPMMQCNWPTHVTVNIFFSWIKSFAIGNCVCFFFLRGTTFVRDYFSKFTIMSWFEWERMQPKEIMKSCCPGRHARNETELTTQN